MPQVIPLQPVPNQTTQVVLNNQNCQIDVWQTPDALFFNLSVNDEIVVNGQVCQNLNRLVLDQYLGFSGDFAFNDSQGSTDPNYLDIGTRYQLLYYNESELP
jgi:hypothetical protein